MKVFGFGVGYGQLLFFLKNFMRAKVKGVELGYFSKDFTNQKRLGVIHGISADDPNLRRTGKFDVTYSIDLLQTDVLDKKTALGMLDNLARMTKKGGRSYHILVLENPPVTREEIEARGFKIDIWRKSPYGGLFIKLTKVRD